MNGAIMLTDAEKGENILVNWRNVQFAVSKGGQTMLNLVQGLRSELYVTETPDEIQYAINRM